MKDVFEDYLTLELKLANKHLPYNKISLCQAMTMEKPELVLRDGSTHRFNRSELLLLNEILGEDSCELLLPIYIYYDYSVEGGLYFVKGKHETKVITKILNKEARESTEIFLTRPELIELRIKLRTATTIVFITRRLEEREREY